MKQINAIVTFALAGFLFSCGMESPTAPTLSPAHAGSESVPLGRRRPVTPGIRVIPPPCVNPAPFEPALSPAPGYIVSYRDDIDAIAATQMFEAKYGFVAGYVYRTGFKGFWAMLTLQMVAALRCEPAVTLVGENGYGTVAKPNAAPPN